MMKISKEVIFGTGICATVIIFGITCRTLLGGGYARDAGLYVPKVIDSLMWMTIPTCFAFFAGFMIFFRKEVGEKGKKFAFGLLVVFVIFGIGVNAAWAISLSKEKNSDIQHEHIRKISLSELESVIDEAESEVVYIGRDNCPLCEFIIPDFVAFLEEKNIDVLYYNTKQDRETNKENMERVLGKIQVFEVPFIMVIEDNEIVAKFMGEHMVDQLRDYMETQ